MTVVHDVGAFFRLGVGLVRDQRFWKRAPHNPLTEQGYEVAPDLLSAETCARLVEMCDTHLRDESYVIGSGSAYLVRRRQGPRDYDTQISQLMNAQDLDEELGELFRSGRIEKLFESRLQIPVVLETISIQVDDVDTTTKRGYHVDRLTPPTLKLFTYLTDVEDTEDGPYTVIPGSHLHVQRKLLNLAHNMRQRAPWTDMSQIYNDRECVSFFGRAGTTVISTQTLAHKGWHHQSRRRRVCLICYVTPRSSWSGSEFALGREFVSA